MNTSSSIAGLWLCCGAIAPAQELPPDAGTLQRLCGECHVGMGSEEDFDLLEFFGSDAELAPAQGERLALAVQRLRARTMPPPDAAQPTDEERLEMVAHLAGRAPIMPGARVATLRRLTRKQYEYTVRDLFFVAWSAGDLLPEDATAHGFDGQGDVQHLSPLLLEKYFEAANDVADTVLRSPAATEAVFGTMTAEDKTPQHFLVRAYRRPIADEESAALVVPLYAAPSTDDARRARQRSWLLSTLASPSFLYRAEIGRADQPALLTAHELAVRLSYALSSTMPDAPLRALAESGQLLEPAILVSAAKRLVRIEQGRRFAEDFGAQWLGLRDVLSATADFRRYPQIWNGALRPAFLEEALRYFAAIVDEDRCVLELLDADSTFVDAALAQHYGLPPVEGGFQRVTLTDRRRGGVLGMGAMLMASSYPLRTSPVKRGQWILAKLLDAPPPPPPANAGVLPADDKQDDQLTLRQRLERHRKDPGCASCHAQMDALGFALENYDVLGLWREEVHGAPIDTVATLPGGVALDGPLDLKAELMRRADEFVRCFAKKMLVHGIGRDMLLADEVELAKIVATSRAGAHRFSALLEAVVTSPLFLARDLEGLR